MKADVFAEVASFAAAALLEVVPRVATCGADFALYSRTKRIELNVAGARGDGLGAEQGVFEASVPETATKLVADIVALGELTLQVIVTCPLFSPCFFTALISAFVHFKYISSFLRSSSVAACQSIFTPGKDSRSLLISMAESWDS